MWIVTGGAGFIGSALVATLNSQGFEDILIVDRLGSSEKWKNLRHLKYADYLEADPFLRRIIDNDLPNSVQGIVHLGACSATTEQNASYLIQNNFEYSKTLARWCIAKKKRFIYASSGATYGDGRFGYAADIPTLLKIQPLNMYGYSKQMFDVWCHRQGYLKSFVGVKFFNIYGPNEYHKGPMRSMVAKAFEQIKKEGYVRLFKSHRKDFKDGEQQRDFLYVKDAVALMIDVFERGQFGLGICTRQEQKHLDDLPKLQGLFLHFQKRALIFTRGAIAPQGYLDLAEKRSQWRSQLMRSIARESSLPDKRFL